MPIYGDLPSLTQCIKSLIQYLDTENHKVLLVNDVGPDADAIEDAVLKQIKNKPGFKYERNPANLGFIGTCNRAVFELDRTKNDILLLNSDTVVTEGFIDEMHKVLYADYKHGAVCPRSNNATITSMPFLRKDGNVDIEREIPYTNKVYDVVKDMLPDYTLSPVAHGFCMLIKRFLIEDFGLFDPIYGLGYNEENDFCMRINQYGFSSIIANKAMVYHLESKSFTSDKKKQLQEKNHKILISRYPYYEHVVADYLRYGIDPIDRFADVISTGKDEPKKVLVNFYHMPLSMNGTARNCLSFLQKLATSKMVKDGKIIPTIIASKEAELFHNLSSFGVRILRPHEVNELFHLAICPLQIFHSDNLQLMNRSCLKIVYAHLDIIAIRSNYLLTKSVINRSIFQDSLRVADRIIMISRFTYEDTLAYYPLDHDTIKRKSTILLQGYPDVDFQIDASDIDHSKDKDITEFVKNDDYLMIVGNDFKHKMIDECVKRLSDANRRIVVLGTSKKYGDKILSLESGGISDHALRLLYKNARLIVFPSLYEGFGLPIAEAAKYRKPVVAANYELNREVKNLYKKYSNIELFSSMSTMTKAIERMYPKSPHNPQEVPADAEDFRTISDYNSDMIRVVQDVLDEPTDARALRERWDYLSRIDQYMVYGNGDNGRMPSKSVVEKSANFLKSRNKHLYLFARSVYRSTVKKK